MNVSAFAKRVGISPHTVRYYDSIGLLHGVQRLPNGHRSFGARDVEWIRFVQRLKDTGMPLVQIRRYADLRAQGETTLAARQDLLEAHASWLADRLATQEHHLLKLNEKIAWYRSLSASAD